MTNELYLKLQQDIAVLTKNFEMFKKDLVARQGIAPIITIQDSAIPGEKTLCQQGDWPKCF